MGERWKHKSKTGLNEGDSESREICRITGEGRTREKSAKNGVMERRVRRR